MADLAGPPEPIVMLLEREPGQKEPRWEHQLGVEGTAEAGSHAPASAPASIPARPAAPQVEAESMMLRIKYLEQQMREVQAELSRLRGTTDLV